MNSEQALGSAPWLKLPSLGGVFFFFFYVLYDQVDALPSFNGIVRKGVKFRTVLYSVRTVSIVRDGRK